MTGSTETYPRDSEDYVAFQIKGSVDLDMDVEVSLRAGGPDTRVWMPATWVGAVATTRDARSTVPLVFSVENYPAAAYIVEARVADSPENPIIELGTLYIG
jgi:hypothetical protein